MRESARFPRAGLFADPAEIDDAEGLDRLLDDLVQGEGPGAIPAPVAAPRPLCDRPSEHDVAGKWICWIVEAEGAARAQEIVRSALSDSYLEFLWIRTLSVNPNVIYVASPANLPIFKSAKWRRT